MRHFVIVLFSAVLPTASFAGFSSDFRVSNHPASARTEVDGGRNVTVSDGVVGVVWSDVRNGNEEIYFRERVLGTWNSEVRLTNDAGSSTHPAIGQFPNETRVVWEDDRSGHPEIWMKRKVLGAWLPDSCLTCDAFESTRPAIDHGGEHVVWEETRDGNREIYYRHRLQSGTWDAEVRVSNDTAESSHPSVASQHPTLHGAQGLVLVAWQDDRDGNWEIYTRSQGFMGWGPEVRVSNDAASSRFPSAWVELNTCSDALFPEMKVAWQDDRDGNDEIYLANGDPGFWVPAVRVTTTPTPSLQPSLSTAVHVVPGIYGGFTLCPVEALVWHEYDFPGFGGSIRYLDPLAGPVTVVSDFGADPQCPSIAVDNDFPSLDGSRLVEIVWTDRRDGNWAIYETNELTIDRVTDAPETAPAGRGLQLSPGRPNPFHGTASFSLVLERESVVEARVLDAAGRVVKEVHRGTLGKGPHILEWDGTTGEDRPAPAGVYFLRVESGDERRTRKIVRVR